MTGLKQVNLTYYSRPVTASDEDRGLKRYCSHPLLVHQFKRAKDVS
ncbi:MAG TPA: hypothetical protein VFB12_27370 [Ktedonobacteraceae bacterium]|nr:hypothetical protein [Ktedonobacteraceae bacterium]